MPPHLHRFAAAALLTLALLPRAHATPTPRDLAPQLAVGDLVFIRAKARPFIEVAAATGSWTNHVGIVIATDGAEPTIAESTFPFSRTTSLSRFVARSEGGRVAVKRLADGLDADQAARIAPAALRRTGIFYDTGFDLHSRRQFCSRFAREVLQEATGTAVGDVETFGALLRLHPAANVGFWTVWYFGRIPWDRKTVTPDSVLRSAHLATVFDGTVARAQRR